MNLHAQFRSVGEFVGKLRDRRRLRHLESEINARTKVDVRRRGLIFGAVALALTASISLPTWDDAYAVYIPKTATVWNALDYNVTGNGSTDDSAAINTLLNNAANAGASVWFPGGLNYNCGSTQLVVPDGLSVVASATAIFTRSVDRAGATPYNTSAAAMVFVGNHCHWVGGVLNNTAVLATSTTSNTIGTGSKTFSTQAGLPLTASSFIRIWSASAPSAKYEGLVSAYNIATGSLTINATFDGGSGTHADWNITFAGVWQCPMVLHGVTDSVVENVRITGNWYVGLLMEGWNPSTGGSLVTTNCTFRNCYTEAVQNRAIYLYGTCTSNLIDGCFMQGSVGVTDYTFNMDPANATGSVNFQQQNKIVNCSSVGAAFQGFEIGDLCSYNTIANCSVTAMTNSAAAGFLVQLANTQLPQFNLISGCIARSCPGFGMQIVGANYTNVVGFSAITCGVGIEIVQSSGSGAAENSCQDILTTACTTGVVVASGSVNTLLTGRSVANTTNVSDGGTGTVKTNLITV